MPCKTVTVEGPSITGEVKVVNVSLSGGEEQFSATITIENTALVNATGEVVMTGTVGGGEVFSQREGFSMANQNNTTISVSGEIGVDRGNSVDLDFCADVDQSSVSFGG